MCKTLSLRRYVHYPRRLYYRTHNAWSEVLWHFAFLSLPNRNLQYSEALQRIQKVCFVTLELNPTRAQRVMNFAYGIRNRANIFPRSVLIFPVYATKNRYTAYTIEVSVHRTKQP